MMRDYKIFPDDKIRVILANTHLHGIPDAEILHTTIYEAKKKYPLMFSDFNFRTSGTYPHSELLERITMRMRISHIDFDEKSKRYVKDHIEPKFDGEELYILYNVAEELMGSDHMSRSGILKILVDNCVLPVPHLVGEHGLSIFLQSDGKRILFDTGRTSAYIRNASKMKTDLSNLDCIVLSHEHEDHAGGLAYLRTKNAKIIRTSDRPIWISKNIVFLGDIPRTHSFERDKNNDSALTYRTQNGLVIITGCSHSGICNIIDYAREVCKDDRILDIVGGLHLLNPSVEQMKGTCNYLKRVAPTAVHACHCTSLASKIELAKVCPIKETGVGLQLEYVERDNGY